MDKRQYEAFGSLAVTQEDRAGMMNQAQAKIEKPTELDNAFGEALRANGDLQRAIESLAKRIAPVLAPEGPSPKDEHPKLKPSVCTVINMLNEVADRDRFLANHVMELLSRVAI